MYKYIMYTCIAVYCSIAMFIQQVTGFTIYGHCAQQGWIWTRRYIITTYAITAYTADIITLECEQLFLFTGHVRWCILPSHLQRYDYMPFSVHLKKTILVTTLCILLKPWS